MEIELQEVKRHTHNKALKEPLLEEIHVIDGEDEGLEEEDYTLTTYGMVVCNGMGSDQLIAKP